MKYTYAYKTSDGTRHEAVIHASCREEVFNTLRQQGIKAIKVVAADGSKANGEIRGVRKRVVASIVFITAVLAVVAAYFVFSKQPDTSSGLVSGIRKTAQPLERQLIVGDRKKIESASNTIFRHPAEAYLSFFAEPGRPLPTPETKRPQDADFLACLKDEIQFSDTEFTEHIDLKRMVVHIKRELQDYLRAGGTVSDFLNELTKRQQQEIEIRDRAEKKLNDLLSVRADSKGLKQHQQTLRSAYEFWLKANAQLQAMGIYPLPLTEQLRSYQYTADFNE